MQNIGQLSKTDKCLVFSGSVIPGLPTNVLQRYEAFHFNGNIITDSLEISQQLKHLGYCKNRYYYVKNYDWEKVDQLSYRLLKNTLFHPSVELIANDQNQAVFLQQLTHKKIKHIMPNWDINILRQIGNE